MAGESLSERVLTGLRPGSLVAGYRLSFLISTAIIVFAAALVAVQLRPRGGPEDAEVHEPAREDIPVPALAECQLRQC